MEKTRKLKNYGLHDLVEEADVHKDARRIRVIRGSIRITGEE